MIAFLGLLVQICLQGRYDTDRHLLTLFAIALASKGQNYLELGVRDGHSTAPILAAAMLNKGQLFSVDIKDTPFKPAGAVASHWHFIKGDALAFLERWVGPIDFVFIDDWHSGGHVKRELELIGRWVGLSSVILLHDLMYMGHAPHYRSNLDLPESDPWGAGGPYQAVAELDTSIWEWATLPWGHGLTLLRKKN